MNMHQLLFLFIIFLTFEVIHSSILQVKINYPDKYIQPLHDGSVFNLYVCYLPGCPTFGIWNSSGPTFTVYASDGQNNNLYVKNITLSAYVGKVWVAISGSQNSTDGTTAISECDPSGCNSLGVPYMTYLSSVSSLGTINAYPWFNIVEGNVYTMFHHMYSPQLGVYRDINVYIPPSMSQNSLSRRVNIIILNDGDMNFMTTLTKQGGLDRAIQNGDVPQDTIMIGIPQNLTCERGYELTYEACDPTRMDCTDCKSGGGLYFTYFLRNTVIPAVLTNLSMSLGEVSMTGSSLGGLTACAAASFQPSYFQRGFCMSPSTWWNHGSLAINITQNAKKYGLPKSIVMYIGTEEGTSEMFQGQEWMVTYNQTMQAWIDAGLTDSTRFFSFSLNGGEHLRTDWVAIFAIGITRMYLSEYTGSVHNQPYSFRQNEHITYPTSTNYTCNTSDDVTTYENMIIGFGIILGIILFLDIAFIAGYFTFYVPYVEAVQEARILGIDLGARVSFYSHMKTTLGWNESEKDAESAGGGTAAATAYVPPNGVSKQQQQQGVRKNTPAGAAAGASPTTMTNNPMRNPQKIVTQRASLTAPKRTPPNADQML